MAEFITKDGKKLKVEYDYYEVVVLEEDGKRVGSFQFREIEMPYGCESIYNLHLCHMELMESYRGQGIGRFCLKVAMEQSGMQISASDPDDLEEKEDGSHLIGDGPEFVRKMQKEGLIMGGDSPDPDDY